MIGIVAFGIIAWHDGLIGVTSMRDINQGDISSDTVVTVKGEYLGELFNVHSIREIGGSAILFFTWDGATPADNSIVVVTGTVASIAWLEDVTSFNAIWIFQ